MDIGFRSKKAIYSILCMCFIIICLIGVCTWRLLDSKKYSLMVNVVLIGLIIVGVFWLFKQLIEFFSIFKSPKVLVKYDDNKLYIYEKKEYSVINIEDIIRVETGLGYSNKFLFYNSNLVVRTKTKSYVAHQIDDVDGVIEKINSLLNK